MTPSPRLTAALALALAAASPAAAQHVTVPFLAGPPQRGLIAFEGAECDVEAGGLMLRCRFQQVYLTTEHAPPDTCMITTSGYDRAFRKESDARWISRGAPEGPCGTVETATLDDGGGVRWTMTVTKAPTRDAAPECRAVDPTPEVMSWRDVRRPLPCRFVQPGALQR